MISWKGLFEKLADTGDDLREKDHWDNLDLDAPPRVVVLK